MRLQTIQELNNNIGMKGVKEKKENEISAIMCSHPAQNLESGLISHCLQSSTVMQGTTFSNLLAKSLFLLMNLLVLCFCHC